MIMSMCLAMGLSSSIMAQEYVLETKQLGFEDGLVSRSINEFFEDSNGFMWFGTNEGINRYDGTTLLSYTMQNGLRFNKVTHIAEDDQGKLWLLNREAEQRNQRIQVFDPIAEKSQSLSEYLNDSNLLSQSTIRFIGSRNRSGKLWITIQDGTVYQFKNGNLSKYWTPLKPYKDKELAGMAYGKRSIWQITRSTLYQIFPDSLATYDITEYAFTSPFAVDSLDNIINQASSDLTIYGDKAPLLMRNGGIIGKDGLDFMVGKRLLGIDELNQHIWLSGSSGLKMLYDFDLNLITEFNDPIVLYSRPKYMVFNSSGIGWLNQGEEVLMTRVVKRHFKNYLTGFQIFGQYGYGARGLYVKGDTLYSNGLGPSFKTSLTTGEKVEFGPSGRFYSSERGDQATLKRLDITQDREGNLWYTDESHRLARYNESTGTFTDYSYTPDFVKEAADRFADFHVHWAAFFDSNNTLWLGRRSGLSYKKQNESFVKEKSDYGRFEELKNADVFDFLEDEAGIWIASTAGLYLMDLSGKIKKRYFGGVESAKAFPSYEIAHIRKDEDGSLWLSSRGGGIIKFDPESETFQQWTTKEGLSHNTVYVTFEDDFGYLWASSNKGIMRIRMSDMEVSTFTKKDGLHHEEFNTTSYYQAEDGRMFFGSLDGVTAFDPKDFLGDTSQTPTVRWTGLEKQVRKTGLYANASQELFQNESVRIKPGELGFRLNFSLFDYFSTGTGSYAYMIDGLDTDWNYITEPTVRINALPYGQYKLKVKGQAIQGQWTNERAIDLMVLRPVYLRWWFLVLAVLVVAGAVLLLFRYRIKSLKRTQEVLEQKVQQRTQKVREQAEELKEMDHLKSKFFANVSHELRTPLTLILGPVSNLLKNETLSPQLSQELKRVLRNGNNMSNLVEEILDLSRLDSNKLQVTQQITLVKEYFEVIFGNFMSEAQYKDIEYTYSYSGNEELTVLLDQRLVNRIVNNLLSNAFKFTGHGQMVSLAVTETELALQISVSDSGVGISDKDLPHIFDRFFQTKDPGKSVMGGSGIGLSMSRELAKLLGGELTVKSTEKEGSIFTLALPKNSYKGAKESALSTGTEQNYEATHEAGEDFDKISLLLVEDNRDLREFIGSVLDNFEHILQAGNGKEALALLDSEPLPDIIISDLMMPEMDGMELLERLKDRPDTRHIPVLMLTARSAEEDKLEAFSLGVDDYLLKPFSIEELKARLRNMLKHAAMKQGAQLEETNAEPEESTDQDSLLLKEIERYTRNGVHRVDFNMATVAAEVGMSERQLQRKLKSITGFSPQVFIKEVRLQMARGYLERKEFQKISDVSKAVGFSTTPYFSRMFRDRFGKLPSDYFQDV